MRIFFTVFTAASFALLFTQSSFAADRIQSDWSGGTNDGAPVNEWTDEFDSSSNTSWLSVPGQIALSSQVTNPFGDFVTQTAPLCRAVASGDLDGDGDLDLMTALPLTSFPGTGKVRWYENAGDGIHWTEHEVDDDFFGGSAVTAADLDGDEDLDIVASAFYGDRDIGEDRNGRYVWYENLDGAAGSWAKHLIAEGFWGTQMVATADIDEDGDLDVYGSSSLTHIGNGNDDIYWFENLDESGGSWLQHRIDDDFPDALETVASDIDGDGDLDVASVDYGGHDLAWWENEGGGLVWSKHVISTFTLTDNAIDSADIDGDGDMDLVAAGFNSAVVGWYENLDGEGGSWAANVVGAIANGSDVVIADLDGDGLLDILAASSASSNAEVAWFRNLGNGANWGRFRVDNTHDRGMSAIPADIDGDGSLEVLFTQEGASAGDISGIQRRTITRFGEEGELVSAVLDAQSGMTWTNIDWDATAPGGTGLAFQVRSSNDPGDLGAWSAEIGVPGSLDGVLAPDTRYMQYRVLLATNDTSVSPIVREVAIASDAPAGLSEDGLPGGASFASSGLMLSAPHPNPTSGVSRIVFQLAAPGAVTMDILDATGRRLSTTSFAGLSAGAHEAELPSLRTGIYLVRVTANGISEAQKLVVR